MAVALAAIPFTVKLTVVDPTVVAEIRSAVKVPSPLSVTAPTVPAVDERVTTLPAEVTTLPYASSRVTVTNEVDAPSATIEVGFAVIVEIAGDGAPAVNVTVTVCAPATPFRVKLMTAFSGVVGAVSVAVYVPSPLSVTGPSIPVVVAIVTGPALCPVRFPNESSAVTVITAVDDPSAMRVSTLEVMVDVAGSGGPAMKSTVVVAAASTPPMRNDRVAVPVVDAGLSVAV